jgi:MtrB/PioB family decaheme-associated outer membrane protein
MRRRLLVFAAVLALSTASFAQESASEVKDFQSGEVNLGLFQVDQDTLSSKFLEYRDLPNGVTGPFFRIFGKKGEVRYDLAGEQVQQNDQRYLFKLESSAVRVTGEFNKIPHRFGNSGRTLLQATSPGVLELSNTLQSEFQSALEAQRAVNPAGINFAFLSALVDPSIAAGNIVDLELVRSRGNLDIRLTPNKAYDIRVSYFREKRFGDRAASGTSFGFSNVVETPEPVDYLTQDIGASAEYGGTWGMVRGALRYNWFENKILTQAWDNPFRILSSTDPSAYTAPGAGSINGPAFGLMALPPDNNAVNASLGTTLKLASHTRLTADFSFGFWRQNETPFVAYTTNTAITTPLQAADLGTLPERQLDGQINTSSQVVALTSRPAGGFTLRARYRRYDLNNETPRIEFPGYVRFDSVWEEIPRISVPYGYTNDRLDATASYDFGPVTVEGGYRFTGFDRTFRESTRTTENAGTVAVNLRARGWVLVRGTYERASRDLDEYDYERSEEASRLAHDPPTQQPTLLRFDQAPRDSNRLGGELQLAPGGSVLIGVSYLYNKDEYTETSMGLIDSKWDSLTANFDYTPGDRWNVFAYYTREDITSFQRGRQSGATPSTRTIDDWTADIATDVNSVGAGGNFGIVADKVYLKLQGRYQKVDGFNDLASPPGGTPDVAFAIADFDDTKLLTVGAEVEYRFAERWGFAVGGWFEDYEIRDAFTSTVLNYYPGSFFLAADNGDYQAKVGYVRLSYRW